MFENLSDQEQARREKLARLQELNIPAYPARCQRTHTAQEAVAALEAAEATGTSAATVWLTGRLVALRIMGKASFAHIEDGSGRFQLFIRQNDVGAEIYENLLKKLLDLGDFVEASGALVRTKTGEPSCQVQSLRLISKALHPLPDKWHGLRDVETRFRQRYVDLLANPEVRQTFVTRARIVSAIRRYLDEVSFLEVETPILQPLYGGAEARPFVTFHNQLKQNLYLRISFELYLKRLLVGGYERVYEIGRDFRNEGISFKHNPEFTQLEFYEAYSDYGGMMRRCEELITSVARALNGHTRLTYQGHELDLTPPWRRLTMREAIRTATGLDYADYADAASLAAAMRGLGHPPEANANRGKLIESLFATHVEPNLVQPTFILDYPVEISPLAKKKDTDPTTVERFECFIGGMEISNAFSELNDPLDQLQRFEDMGRALAAGDEDAHPLDEDFITALCYGLPPTGGCGIGIDRLAMIFTDQPTIREVVLFPHLRTKET
ncbi:MAG: lysine--tRNA ligase [Anaerolineae bacterium]|uniref:lysine--tRNA ligase n=1 Tax=Candidatus Amarolinea dominans TaxID=3140696 RepID=UPI001D5AFEBB|nr:lysine--tRNA ligase [Anaerolineae bacterium]